MLARNLSATWIAKHAEDLLAQAYVEYAKWLKDNPPAENPVGWILHCARWRAMNLLDSEKRRPRQTSLDAVFHLADESTPGPAQRIIERASERRVLVALRHLPPKERELLYLVYYEGMSIRGAGQELGWEKSAADRHHAAAAEKMRAMLKDLGTRRQV